MRPIVYRMRAGLAARWAAVAGLATVVAVAGALALTLVAGSLRTVSAPDRYASWWGDDFDATLEQSGGPPRAAEVAALPSVAAVEMASFVFGSIIPADGEDPADLLVFAGSPAAVGMRVVDGRAPDPGAPGEFVATRSFVEGDRASIGDGFRLVTVSQAQADERGFDVEEPDGPTLEVSLVGVVDGPSELQDDYPLALFGSSLLDVGDVGVSASPGLVALVPGATLDDLRADLDSLPDGEVFGIEPADPIAEDVRAAVRTQGQGLAVVAVIVAVAAVAVVGQLLSRQVRQVRSQQVALRALGLRRSQLAVDAAARAAVAVALGALGASLLALAFSGVFPIDFVRRVEPHPGLRFDPLVHGGGAVALVAVLLAWLVVANLVGDRAAPAVRRVGLVERLAPRIRPASAATGARFAFSRPNLQSGPAGAPIAGLAVVLAVLVGALTFGLNLGRLVDDPARYGNNFDASIGQGGSVVPVEVLALLAEDPDVAGATSYGTVLAASGSTAVDVTGMDPFRGDLTPRLLDGRLPANDGEIALGRVAARDLDVGIGDEVGLAGSNGRQAFRVTGLVVVTSLDGGDGMGEGGTVTLDGLRRLEPEATLGTVAVRFRPGAPAGTLQRLTEATGMAMGPADPPSAIVNLERIRSMPYLVVAALAVLAVLSLAHQLIVSAQRRRRDVAVLRALGAGSRWVAGALHWQATLLAVFVLAVATPLGIAAGRVLARVFADRLGAPDDLAVPYWRLGLVLAGLLVLGNAVAAVPARRSRHEPPAAALAEG